MSSHPPAEILATRVICKQPGRYIGWPSIAATRAGELLAVFSGDRDAHVCPWGKTQLIRSLNQGQTWSPPVTVNNTPLDDRDAGILETAQGTLVVSWFTSLAFDNPGQIAWQKLPPAVQTGWQRHVEKLSPAIRRQWLGNWVCRSTDGGRTWSDPIDSLVSTPHGPACLADGTLLYVGLNHKVGDAKLPPPPQCLAAAESCDDARTWRIVGTIPIPDHVQASGLEFHEPHVVETADGRLVAMFRYHGTPGQYHLWQSESADRGHTWTTLRQTDIWGYPPHLLRLRNGWLVVSYGRRRPPFGEMACLSRDGGATWDVEQEITLATAPNGDLGYPASVQLADDSILTVYYQVDQPNEPPCLMATHWRLKY